MRDLERNKTTLWYTTKSSQTDKVDGDGNYTGEKITTYATPIQVSISLYPATGDIVESVFGKDCSFDMLATSTTVVLDKFGLLYTSQPTSDFDTTYLYKVSSIKKSLNTMNYGLESRT